MVTYDNPLDNVTDLAHHFFSRCLKAEVVPYVVTKKTVFKWQEGFWVRMKEVFDENYRQDYLDAGLLDGCGEGPLPAVSRVVSTRLLSPVLVVPDVQGESCSISSLTRQPCRCARAAFPLSASAAARGA